MGEIPFFIDKKYQNTIFGKIKILSDIMTLQFINFILITKTSFTKISDHARPVIFYISTIKYIIIQYDR